MCLMPLLPATLEKMKKLKSMKTKQQLEINDSKSVVKCLRASSNVKMRERMLHEIYLNKKMRRLQTAGRPKGRERGRN